MAPCRAVNWAWCLQDLTPHLANALGLRGTIGGAVISDVKAGSAADAAGLKVGDVVVGLDNEPIQTSGQLRMEIGTQAARDKACAERSCAMRMKVNIAATLRQPADRSQNRAGASGDQTCRARTARAAAYRVDACADPAGQQELRQGERACMSPMSTWAAMPTKPACSRATSSPASITSRSRHPRTLAKVVQAEPANKPSLLQVRRGDSSVFVAIG